MARRKLSTQGRIVAAGLSLGVAGVLAGFMAAGDHTADASQPASVNGTGSVDSPTRGSPSSASPATPYDGSGDSRGTSGTTNDDPQHSPQPQTRTGGS
jgi:hypothetical protein